MKEQEIIDALKNDNDEFRRLYEEHRRLEDKLSELEQKRYLTTEEEVERKQIQKQKLHKKDQMAELIRQYRQRVLQAN